MSSVYSRVEDDLMEDDVKEQSERRESVGIRDRLGLSSYPYRFSSRL
ncbi:MAG: hypothetical protein JWM11_4302 [Planctomycetaceae bacterium]|nr:hypothetical protein [Planctomycetaceae bacterium]